MREGARHGARRTEVFGALIEGPTYLKGWDDYLPTSIGFFCIITFSSVSYYAFMLHDG
jgi:hypothetical protein